MKHAVGAQRAFAGPKQGLKRWQSGVAQRADTCARLFSKGQWAHSRAAPHCPCLGTFTLDSHLTRGDRQLASLCPRHAWEVFGSLRVGGPAGAPNPALRPPRSGLSTPACPPRWPPGPPAPDTGHILILLAWGGGGGQRPQLGSEDGREISGPRASPGPSHPYPAPTDRGSRRSPRA